MHNWVIIINFRIWEGCDWEGWQDSISCSGSGNKNVHLRLRYVFVCLFVFWYLFYFVVKKKSSKDNISLELTPSICGELLWE